MEESFFNDIDVDLDEVSDNPYAVADGTYLCVIGKAYREDKDGKRNFRLVWNVDEPESKAYKLPIRERFRLPLPSDVVDGVITDSDAERGLSKLKNRCKMGLGLTNEEFKRLSGDLLLGKQAYVTVKNNPDQNDPLKMWVNVVSVVSVDQYEQNMISGGDNYTDIDGI